jgi:ribose transport system substrate-binding protein
MNNALRRSRRLSGVLALALVSGAAALSGCGGEPSSADAAPGQNAAGTAFAAEAKAATEKRTAKQTEWLGPKDGPKTTPGKRIVYIASDNSNALASSYGKFIQQAASQIGWQVTVLDGKATASNWVAALQQAIALKPDGIAMSLQSPGVAGPLAEAAAQGIPVVGMHSADLPGPNEKYHLFNNVSSDPAEVGRAMVDWAIAHSGGTARIVTMGDNTYPISVVKTEAMKAQIAKCGSCQLLLDANVPAADVSSQMGGITSSWVQKYQRPFYVLGVGDFWFDFAVPALRTGSVQPKDVVLGGADGTEQAYQRVRTGEYQQLTVPEPIEFQAWQAVDELNRAINKQPPTDFVQPVYIVTKDNIDAEGGASNGFSPSNGFKERYLAIWKG